MPKFVATKKGQGDALMVGGMVMVGALIANKSPVSMRELTPIARLTGEFEVIVVNAASPLKSMKDLVDAFKADPGKVSWAGGSAGGTDHILAGMIAKSLGVEAKRVVQLPQFGRHDERRVPLLGERQLCLGTHGTERSGHEPVAAPARGGRGDAGMAAALCAAVAREARDRELAGV